MLRLPRSLLSFSSVVAALLCTACAGYSQAPGPARVEAIRFWSFGDVTRVAIQTQGDYKLTSDQIDNPSRVYFDLSGLRPPATLHRGIETIQVNDRRVKEIRVAEVSPGRTRIVFDLEGPVEVVSSQLVDPDRLMIEFRPKGTTLPTLSVTHSVTESQRVDLSSNETTAPPASDSMGPASLPSRTSNAASPLAPAAIPGVSVPPLSARIPTGATSRSSSITARPITTIQTQDGFVVRQASVASTPSLSAPNPVSTAAYAPVNSIPAPASVRVEKTTAPAAPAITDSMGDRSLVRVFGLKMGKVVIDAGHGGHDTGTIGPGGLMEKDLVLDVALRLGRLISERLGAEVVYTRSTDIFIPLEDRTKIANDEKADLFISIHANSSPEPSATGVETYYFNLTSDRSGLDLATRENATSGSSISDLNDLLHRAVLQTKLEESREFAQKVQSSLWATSVRMNSRSRDRGVRQAPFVVLIGATMPSILAEIGFISNPHDEKLLKKGDQRQKIAEALFKGVSQYANSLSHVQLARASSR